MKVEHLIIGAFVAAIVAGVFLLERAKWRECRRYHPVWYCVMQGGK